MDIGQGEVLSGMIIWLYCKTKYGEKGCVKIRYAGNRKRQQTPVIFRPLDPLRESEAKMRGGSGVAKENTHTIIS